MANPVGRPPGASKEKIFGEALRMEIAEAGENLKVLRKIARNLLHLAQQPEQAALAAIREVGDRLDGKPKQETEVSLRTAVARELTDDDLAALAVGASMANEQLKKDPKPDSTPLN